MPKVIVLKCEELPSEEMAGLCEVRDKLTRTGVGDLAIKIYGEMLDRDTAIIESMTKAQLDPSFISEVSDKLAEHRRELLVMLFEEADVDIPVCTSTEDRGCITIRVVTRGETRRIGIYYVDEEGNYVRIYT
jgi:hypothetical protein